MIRFRDREERQVLEGTAATSQVPCSLSLGGEEISGEQREHDRLSFHN